MKVLFLLTYYYPHWTGLTQYAQRLAEGLSVNKFRVTVLTTKHEKFLKGQEKINGVKVIRKPVLFRVSRTLISPLYIASFLSEIFKTDIIVVYLPFAEVLIASIFAKILGKKIFLVHNGDLVLPKSNIFNSFIEWLYYFSTTIALFLCTKIIIQTKDYAYQSNVLSRFQDKWSVILPLYPVLSPQKDTVERVKARIGRAWPIIGFAGRFVYEKGFDLLFQAIPIVRKAYPDAIFVFAGETRISYESFFQVNTSFVEDNKNALLLLGKLTEKEMGSFYSILDVFVISSRSDCFPSVLVEAMKAGVPSVVTDIPGARWSVLQSGMGLVVSPDNFHDIGQGIIRVIKQRSHFLKRHDILLRIFDYEKTLQRYIALFTEGN